MTQETLGSAVSLTRQSIANIEAGKQNVLATQIGAFCRALEISADELLGLREAPADPKRAAWRERAREAEAKLREIRAVVNRTRTAGKDPKST